MKKAFVIGMVALSTTMSVSTSFAAGAAPMAGRASIVEYMRNQIETGKKAMFDGKATAAGLAAGEVKVKTRAVLKEIDLPGELKGSIESAISYDSAKAAKRLEALAAVGAVKNVIRSSAIKDSAEAESLSKAADAVAKFISVASGIGARGTTTGKNLRTAEEVASATKALEKTESILERVMTYEKAERDSWTAITEKYVELSKRGATSSEEAFIQAIMDVKGVTREKALEIIEKIKNCL